MAKWQWNVGEALDFGLAGGAGQRARDKRGPGGYDVGYNQGLNSYRTAGGGQQSIPWYSSGRGPANRQYEGAFGTGFMSGMFGSMGGGDKLRAKRKAREAKATEENYQRAEQSWNEAENYEQAYAAEQRRLSNGDPYSTYEHALDANTTPDTGGGLNDLGGAGAVDSAGFDSMSGAGEFGGGWEGLSAMSSKRKKKARRPYSAY